MNSGVFMVLNKINKKYYICCSSNMLGSYKSCISGLRNRKAWFEINGKTIENLTNKKLEESKLKALESLRDNKFTREELNDTLKNLNFTVEEIEIVAHQIKKRKKPVVNTNLSEDYEKYGEEAFEFVVLERCSPEEMFKIKSYWMRKLDCTNRKRGYNISPSADGYKKAEETRERMRNFYNSDRGKERKEEFIERTIAYNKSRTDLKGRPLSEEHKRKFSESSKRFWRSEKGEERKEKLRERFIEFNKNRKGKPYSEEENEKIRRFWESEKGKALREASRQRMRKLAESRKGIKRSPLSESHKKKVSEGMKRFYESDKGKEFKERLSLENKSEEHLNKINEGVKRFYESDRGKEFKEKLRQRNIERGKNRNLVEPKSEEE